MANLKKWQKELRQSLKTVSDLSDYYCFHNDELEQFEKIEAQHPISVTPYYANLINWEDNSDPLFKMVVPSLAECVESGSLDVGGEAENIKDQGIQMKYPSTVLILPVSACFSYCRFCFRKRLFNPQVSDKEILNNIESALAFIRANPTVNNVLITGGDPLILKTEIIKKLLYSLKEINHVKIIRFGTRSLTYLPSRYSSDPELLKLFETINGYGRRIYLINHFNHPRELTKEVWDSVNLLFKAGVVLANQSVMLNGVNDSPEIIGALLNKLANYGITPYYLFQCKFVKGSHHFRVPLYRTCKIFFEATRNLNGLAKRVKLIMAHASGKIEIIGTEVNANQRFIYLKYHQARQSTKIGQIFRLSLPDEAYWLDDLPDSNLLLSN